MKSHLLTLPALFFTIFCGLSACATTGQKDSTDSSTNKLTPNGYCLSVGGQVKKIKGSSQAYCLLPGGEIVEIKNFFENNH